MEDRTGEILSAITLLATRLEGIETKLERIETRLDRVDDRLDRLETKVDRLDRRVARVELIIGEVAKRLLAPAELRALGIAPDASPSGRNPSEPPAGVAAKGRE